MKKFIAVLVLIITLIGIAISAVNCYMLYVTEDDIRSFNKANDESYDCILVLGAGLRQDGTPSDMLRDRLDMAILLFEAGVSDTIILSGDRTGDYNEPTAMKAYCTEKGIPEENITTDFTGYSTYDSLNNLKYSHPNSKVIVVTQAYHLYRAIYIGTQMEFEITGVSADFNTYRGQIARTVREAAARFKDFIKVNL